MSPQYFTRWFVLSDDFDTLLFRPWTLITYGFLHFGFLHILFNMLWLYWFGQFVLNLFTGKRLLTVYLLGALFGGLLFVVAYNLFPAFEQSRGFLIGASGAVTAIMVFIATYTPNTEVRIFTFTIKLWHIALFLFLLDLVRIPSSGNAGGLMAHVGGAIFGYIYAIQLAKGHDIGLWFENIMDWVANLFKPRSKKPFKTVHRTKRNTTATAKPNKDKSAHQKKVDGILDKIGKSGYESLTKAEKDFLFKAGKDD
jgi:membrane associated rhomboid family serine protease